MTTSTGPGDRLIVALRGYVSAESVAEVEQAIVHGLQSHEHVALDLDEVTLIDREAARQLADRVRQGIEVVECPVYIRRWILQEKQS